jgi:hypothetical protein
MLLVALAGLGLFLGSIAHSFLLLHQLGMAADPWLPPLRSLFVVAACCGAAPSAGR